MNILYTIAFKIVRRGEVEKGLRTAQMIAPDGMAIRAVIEQAELKLSALNTRDEQFREVCGVTPQGSEIL